MNTTTGICVEALRSAFTEALSPAAKFLVDTEVGEPPAVSDLAIAHLVVGHNFEDDLQPSDKMVTFASLVNTAVEKGLIEHGCVSVPMTLELSSKCRVCERVIATIGYGGAEGDHTACVDGETPIPVQRRALIMFYPYSKYSREELNEQMGGEYFCDEGALPAVWL